MTMTATAPASLDNLRGRFVDCDAHLYIAPWLYGAAMGESFAERFDKIERFFEERKGVLDVTSRNYDNGALVERGKHTPLDEHNVWTLKGWESAAAFDAERRLELLDLMGIDRQIIFPDGFFAKMAASKTPGAEECVRRFNDFGLEWAQVGRGRLRPVAILPMHEVDATLAEAGRMIAAGAYAFLIESAKPPAGLSPADPVWDPLWAMAAEADVPVLLHQGGEEGFIDKRWDRIPSLEDGPESDREGNPFTLATFHFAPQSFVTSLVLGGVFERHPRLRFGAIEVTAQWVGPLAEMLDQRVDGFRNRLPSLLPLKPSEYLRRQLRVTPFFWEPVDVYIERYGIEEVYAFSTDYPHPEGGSSPVDAMFRSVAKLGQDMVDKLFVTNGELLCPERSVR